MGLDFCPTHTIVHDGDQLRVMCVANADDPGWLICYTQGEWESDSAADYEFNEDSGALYFQGQPTSGRWTIAEETQP